MRCYVITETGVHMYNSMNSLKKEVQLEKKDMTKVGTDLVCNMTDQSFEIVKDIKLLEAVASKKVFTKDKFDTTNWLILLGIVVTYLVR